MRNHDLGPSRRPASRRGVALAMALLALTLIVMVFGVLLKRVGGERAILRVEERSIQAGWLAESGLERAAARLERDPDFEGETWTIAAEELGGNAGAEVRIEVERVDGRPRLRRVRVRSDHPPDASRRARRSKTAIIALDEGSEEER